MSFVFSHKTVKVVFAIIAAVLIIAPVSYLIITSKHSVVPETHSLILGPEVMIQPTLLNSAAYSSVGSSGQASLNYSNMTVSVQIYSIVPNIMKHKHFSSPSSTLPKSDYSDELLNKSFAIGTNPTFFLNSSFYNISNQWLSIVGNAPAKVSMTVEASLSYVQGTKLILYTYYNNIAYDPHQNTVKYYEPFNESLVSNLSALNVSNLNVSNITMSSTRFNLSVAFDLGDPFETLNLSAINASQTNTSSMIQPENYYCHSGGSGGSTSSTLKHLSVLTGPLPLLSDYMNISKAAKWPLNSPYSVVDLGTSFSSGDITLSVNSSQADVTSSGSVTIQMSSVPSYDNTLPVIENLSMWNAIPATVNLTSNASYPNDLNNTFGVIYFENATFTISVYDVYTYHWNKIICDNNGQQYIEWQNTSSHSNETNIQVSNLKTTNGNKSGIAMSEGNLSHYIMTARSEDGYNDTISVSHSNPQSVNLNIASSEYWMNLYGAVGSLLNNIFNPSGNTSEPITLGQLTTSGINKTRDAQQVWYSASGYSNLNNVLKNTQDQFDTFAAGLGVASAIIDLAAAADFMDDTTAAIVTSTIELIKSELELSAQILSDFNTIGFTSNTEIISSMIEITNYPEFDGGTTFNIFDYQSNLPMNAVIQGTQYTYYTPADLIFSYINGTPPGYVTYNWTTGLYN